MANWLVHNKIYTYLAVVWTLLIVYLCLQSAANLPQIKVFGLDKITHIIVHFVFTFLWFMSLISFKINFRKAITTSVLLSVVFGVSIEILQQLLTKTRHADIFDVIANTIGAFLAVLITIKFQKTLLF